MRQATALFGPMVEVRDVLESFLREQVLLPGWRETLAEASQQFIALDTSPTDSKLAHLGRQIATLAQSELSQEQKLARAVAADVESLVDRIRVPDLPRPEDTDWSF